MSISSYTMDLAPVRSRDCRSELTYEGKQIEYNRVHGIFWKISDAFGERRRGVGISRGIL
jgi:hypothetical protein